MITKSLSSALRSKLCSVKYLSTSTARQAYATDKETHFGFETVSEDAKAKKVKAVFENVADRYDLMNDCMSAGIHRVWKDIFINRLRPGPKTKLIDVAGGTGDIAFRFLSHKRHSPNFTKSAFFPAQRPTTRLERVNTEVDAQYQALEDKDNLNLNNDKRSVLVCDINEKMLEVGQKRATGSLTQDQLRRINWAVGDAENLSEIPDNSFDVYTIAFGIRNCVHIDQVIREAYRILRPGGRFMCLEFSHVTNPGVKWFYDQYSFQVIPVMGQIIAGDWDSYVYLVQSIRNFPKQDEFKQMIAETGFRFVTYENLTMGVAAIHSGFKL